MASTFVVRSEFHSLVGVAFNTVRSNASPAQLLSISLQGIISASANGTYVIASPRVFYSAQSNNPADVAGQRFWGGFVTKALAKQISTNVQLELGIATNPDASGLSSFYGAIVSPTGSLSALSVQKSFKDLPSGTRVPILAYPAMRVVVSQPNVPLLEVKSLEISYNTGLLSCPT